MWDEWQSKSHLICEMWLTANPTLGWHFRMLFQSSKLKARTSLFTETLQKRRSSFELWAFENVTPSGGRPTQSIMYVPLQVNRSQKCILLIVQYKYIKSCSGDFHSPESDPPHKIMRYDVYYSTQLSFWFPPDRIRQVEMICIGGVPGLKRHFGGAGP